MPVLSIVEIKYMITLHKKNILQVFFNEILEKFFSQFWENLEEIRFETGSKKNADINLSAESELCFVRSMKILASFLCL